MIVTAHIKFGLHSNFLDSMLQAEDERLTGESIEDGVIRVYNKLEKAVSKLKQEAESMRGQIIQEAIQGARENFPPIGGHPIPIISKDVEKLEIDIDNAETLEELESILKNHTAFPGKLLSLVNAKRQEFRMKK